MSSLVEREGHEGGKKADLHHLFYLSQLTVDLFLFTRCFCTFSGKFPFPLLCSRWVNSLLLVTKTTLSLQPRGKCSVAIVCVKQLILEHAWWFCMQMAVGVCCPAFDRCGWPQHSLCALSEWSSVQNSSENSIFALGFSWKSLFCWVLHLFFPCLFVLWLFSCSFMCIFHKRLYYSCQLWAKWESRSFERAAPTRMLHCRDNWGVCILI